MCAVIESGGKQYGRVAQIDIPLNLPSLCYSAPQEAGLRSTRRGGDEVEDAPKLHISAERRSREGDLI